MSIFLPVTILLIAPEGIEILFVHEADPDEILLLIAPEGIEIFVRLLCKYPSNPLNRTRRN